MTTARRAWAAFAVGAGILAAALAFISGETLALETREARSRGEALREERVRLALWRMDSYLSSVLALEAARPPSQYEAALVWPGARPSLEPSPILEEAPFAPFRLLFQVGPDGRTTSPEAPEAGDRFPAKAAPGMRERIETARGLVAGFVRAGLGRQLNPVLEGPAPAPGSGDAGYRQRAERNFEAQQLANTFNGLDLGFAFVTDPALRVGTLQPFWTTPAGGGPPELVFARRVRDSRRELVQGIWTDWPRLRDVLLADARDDFPGGDLLPVLALPADGARMLATIPARFEPGPAPGTPPARGFTPARTAIAVAWGAVAAAAVLAALALRGALDLGERRGRFVSAVTHELRTPLTTFRLYSQMLAQGMAPPEAAKEYLATLERESERLSRVVESVLLYARLEEGRGGAHRERVGAADLLARVRPALERRAAEGGMSLAVVESLDPAAALVVDAQAVEQVLLNLVDNACKYAGGGPDRSLSLEARTDGRRFAVVVADRGPGIPEGERDAVFEPFRRAARDAVGTTPGAGLGLAVARGLARALGGDLVLLRGTGPGAAFRLTLPLDG